MFFSKSLLLFFLSAIIFFQGCKTAESNQTKVYLGDGNTIAHYLKAIQYSKDGMHLFGHESTIMMGVGGQKDWEITNRNDLGKTIKNQKSDVKEMTGQLPAIMGYDAFKLILD